MSADAPVLQIRDLCVSLHSGTPIIDGVSLTLGRGQILGLVGESGSGKSTLAVATLGYARPGSRVVRGEVIVAGTNTTAASPQELPGLRRHLVSYVPQDPSTSLNPSMRIGGHLYERVRDRPSAERDALVDDALEGAQLPQSREFQRRYPHELSGGQQQRVLIAMAIIGRPPLIVLDEPTTGLDVVVQARILEQVVRLRETIGLTMVYVSHDLAAVSEVADRVAVMYAGRLVEEGPSRTILSGSRHPYAVGLLDSVLDPTTAQRRPGIPGTAVGIGEWPIGCAFAPRCRLASDRCTAALPSLEPIGTDHLVRCVHWKEVTKAPPTDKRERSVTSVVGEPVLEVSGLRAEHRGRSEVVVAALDVSFTLSRGRCVALVGESGSGKTTIARCIAGLHRPSAGAITLHGKALAPLAGKREQESRRMIQIVFQNPYDSLNPRKTIGDEVQRPARMLRRLSALQAREEALEALERVRIPARLVDRYPSDLSGGERQRVAIARALAAKPDVLVCDEVTSSLDVSVQAVVLDLLEELREELGLALLFITHDLGVVASVADEVLVLSHGTVREQGPTARVLTSPEDAYTQTLVAAAPRLDSSSVATQP
jgi:peptide/nickel transport system ATP-binding protein